MCLDCWTNLGSPSINNARTRKAAELIAEVYEHHNSGGGLHIALDDWNIDPDSLQWCAQYINDPAYVAGTYFNSPYEEPVAPDRLKAERRCLAFLRRLTTDEVASALAIHERFI